MRRRRDVTGAATPPHQEAADLRHPARTAIRRRPRGRIRLPRPARPSSWHPAVSAAAGQSDKHLVTPFAASLGRGGQPAGEISQAALEAHHNVGVDGRPARRSHSMAAWCGAPLARRCPALHTTAGRGWLCACARRRAAGRTYPVPRKLPRILRQVQGQAVPPLPIGSAGSLWFPGVRAGARCRGIRRRRGSSRGSDAGSPRARPGRRSGAMDRKTRPARPRRTRWCRPPPSG